MNKRKRNEKVMSMNSFVYAFVLMFLFSSCGPKIGDKLTARDSGNDKFYQTWDGKIHPVKSITTNYMSKYIETDMNTVSDKQLNALGLNRYMKFDDEAVNYDNIKAYQDGKGYYVNRWGNVPTISDVTTLKKIRAYQTASPMFFAERLIRGKINIYFAVTYRDQQTGSRSDYFFQKGNEDAVVPLRSFTLKEAVTDCKECKTLLDDAVAVYDDLPKWRRKASDSYIASEKKLVNSLLAVINEYNKH